MNLNNSTTPEAEKDLAQTPKWFVRDVYVDFKSYIDDDNNTQ